MPVPVTICVLTAPAFGKPAHSAPSCPDAVGLGQMRDQRSCREVLPEREGGLCVRAQGRGCCLSQRFGVPGTRCSRSRVWQVLLTQGLFPGPGCCVAAVWARAATGTSLRPQDSA